MTRRRQLLVAAGVVIVLAALYGGLPAVAGLGETWRRLGQGNAWWLALALVLEVASYCGYALLFHAVFASDAHRIGVLRSWEITLAGVAATRLLAAGGAGGVALTAWALMRSGMARTAVVAGITTQLVLLYSVYMAALVLTGVGLRVGVLPGPAPFGLTVVPAIFAAVVIVAALALVLIPAELPWRLGHVVAALGSGVRGAIELLRSRDWRLLGALAWWGFDIGVLWACFHAFGGSPELSVLVLVYFVGMLANLLPLPGGVGGVDGGMIGAAIGFGIDGGLAIVAVLAYRGFAFWLPTLPGALAYVGLRRALREVPALTATEPAAVSRTPSPVR